ncbi:MAG: hypothetical protein GY929_20750 [Actinomycetia bacterium]|nr:hypothetical protein [Actinomycetes bacterium]
MNRDGPRRGLTPARTFIYAVVAIISVAAVVSISRLDTTGNAPGIVLDVEAARQTTRNPFADQWEYTYEVRVSPANGGYTRDLHTTQLFDIGDQVEVLVVGREGRRAFEPVGSVRNLWWLTIAIAGLAVATLLGSRSAARSALGSQHLVMALGGSAAAVALLGLLWIAVPWVTETTAATTPAPVETVHVLGARGGVNLRVIGPSGRAESTNVAASWWFSRGEPGTIDVVASGDGLLVPGDDRFGAPSLAIVGFWGICVAGGALVWTGRHRHRPPAPPVEAPAH